MTSEGKIRIFCMILYVEFETKTHRKSNHVSVYEKWWMGKGALDGSDQNI